MTKRHKDKDIDAAIEYAIGHGWEYISPGKSAHPSGMLRCPQNDPECRNGRFCQISIWSTPRSTGNHARQIRKAVDKCLHAGENDD